MRLTISMSTIPPLTVEDTILLSPLAVLFHPQRRPATRSLHLPPNSITTGPSSHPPLNPLLILRRLSRLSTATTLAPSLSLSLLTASSLKAKTPATVEGESQVMAVRAKLVMVGGLNMRSLVTKRSHPGSLRMGDPAMGSRRKRSTQSRLMEGPAMGGRRKRSTQSRLMEGPAMGSRRKRSTRSRLMEGPAMGSRRKRSTRNHLMGGPAMGSRRRSTRSRLMGRRMKRSSRNPLMGILAMGSRRSTRSQLMEGPAMGSQRRSTRSQLMAGPAPMRKTSLMGTRKAMVARNMEMMALTMMRRRSTAIRSTITASTMMMNELSIECLIVPPRCRVSATPHHFTK